MGEFCKWRQRHNGSCPGNFAASSSIHLRTGSKVVPEGYHELEPWGAAGHEEFISEKKTKKKRFYLISACVDTEIKFKEIKFAKQVSFASQEALLEKLGLLPGSVTPFGLFNDRAQLVGGTSKADEGKKASTETDVQSFGGEAVLEERNFISQNEVESIQQPQVTQEVEFFLDPKVVASPDSTAVDFHPNACHATVCMNVRDFLEFIEQETSHRVNILDLE